jgi:hypothetical protein
MSTATATKNQVATFKIKSPNNLISFLKRFSPIEKSLLLELTPEHLIAKTHTPDRSTIKYSKLALTEVLDGTVPDKLLKIALLDINKVLNVFDHFNEGDEIFLDISYSTVNEETIAFSLKFYTNSLKITLTCADPIQFTYISAEALKRILKSVSDEKILEFAFPKESFSKINSLCKIDSKDDLLKINVNPEGKVLFKGKSFEYKLDVLDPKYVGQEAEMAFYNNQFAFIDQEASAFHISKNKMLVLSSDNSDTRTTIIVLGRIER